MMLNNYSLKMTIYVVIYLAMTQFAFASQISFHKTDQGNSYLFEYQWLDHDEKTQSMAFSLTKKDLFQRYRSFSSYKPKLAAEFVNNAMRKKLIMSPLKDVTVNFIRQGDEYSAQIIGKKQQAIDSASMQLAKLQESFMQDYLRKKYYHRFLTPDQTSAIKPDHARIAIESAPVFKSLKPTIMKKASIKNIRRVSNFILGFVQNVPYSTLESRVTSSGAGFNPPFKLLWENQGDCDSKVTLSAALLRMMMPRIKMVLVFIDNHALIGIDVAPEGNDITVEHEGTTFVLAEPTGPALYKLGAIAPESENAIFSGRYTLEAFYSDEEQTEL